MRQGGSNRLQYHRGKLLLNRLEWSDVVTAHELPELRVEVARDGGGGDG